MNREATAQSTREAIARKYSEIAILQKQLSVEEINEAAAQQAQQTQPANANVQQYTQNANTPYPAQGITNMTAKNSNILALASSISRFLRAANIPENEPGIQGAMDTILTNVANVDQAEVQAWIDQLQASTTEMEKIKPVMALPPATIQESASLVAHAGENPFAKKDDDKGEDKKDEPKSEEKKEDKSDDKKPTPFEKKDEKKEDKPEEKKEEKSEDKKEAPKSESKSEPKKDAPKKKGKEDEEKESYEMSKSETKGAKKAIKLLEDLIKKEKKEGLGEVEPLEMALKEIKEFLFEEKKDHAGDMGMDMPGLPGMDMPGLGMPGMDKGLDLKDPNKMDILVTGPAVPLPPMGDKPMGAGPALGLEKGLHPITDAKPVGPKTVKPPLMEKAPKVDLAKEMGNTSAFKLNDRVWQKTSGESYEIDDEPGRIVAFAGNGAIVVDWGTDIPTEEKATDLVVAVPVDKEASMFEAPAPTIEEETAMGLGAFTPTSQEVQKVLSGLSFADVMAQHVKGEKIWPFEI